ncbi:MAG TPA: DUF5009 domain-containing protein, partial [Bryobacteraceae bacterium]
MLKTEPKTQAIARIASVDIFRGLVILVMIFVNDVSGVRGLPWWTYHMPEGVNGMTYVDMVFPFFLFILGMAIPLATERRLAKGDTPSKLSLHIVLRSLGLVVLGITLANAGRVSAELTGIPQHTWGLLALAGVFLGWNVYPRTGRTALYRIMKYAGFALLAAMLLLFRRRTGQGEVAWLDFGYWEILGLLGCTYFAVALLYLAFRSKPRLFPALLAALVGLNVCSTLGWMHPLQAVPIDASLCSVSMAGVVASLLFFDRALPLPRKALIGSAYGAILLAAGWLTSPLGISKNHGTPAWCLYSAGAAVLLFLALYWVADVKGWTRWAAFVHPAGANTLTTYLLPDVWYFVPFLGALKQPWSEGLPGVVRSLVFTGVILALAAVL